MSTQPLTTHANKQISYHPLNGAPCITPEEALNIMRLEGYTEEHDLWEQEINDRYLQEETLKSEALRKEVSAALLLEATFAAVEELAELASEKAVFIRKYKTSELEPYTGQDIRGQITDETGKHCTLNVEITCLKKDIIQKALAQYKDAFKANNTDKDLPSFIQAFDKELSLGVLTETDASSTPAPQEP